MLRRDAGWIEDARILPSHGEGVRKKLQIGTILAAALCAAVVVVLASRTREPLPGAARTRAGAPSAPPSDPGPPVDRESTEDEEDEEEEEKERVLKVARAYLDARVQTIYGGTTEIMKEIIGRSLGV